MPGNIQLNFGEIRIFSFHPSQLARSKALRIDGFAGWIQWILCGVKRGVGPARVQVVRALPCPRIPPAVFCQGETMR
jgi:hypothetical protein